MQSISGGVISLHQQTTSITSSGFSTGSEFGSNQRQASGRIEHGIDKYLGRDPWGYWKGFHWCAAAY